MRAKLGPALRAAMQFGATFTSRVFGTTPFVAPASGVGRFAGVIGFAAATPPSPNATAATTTAITPRRIQPTQTVLILQNARIPCAESSRPKPDSRTPP